MDLKHGLAGGLAGIAVDVVFFPLETIKTRIMGSSPGENLTGMARSKFRGFSCQMIVSFPYSFTFFYVYEAVRLAYSHSPGRDVMASVAAEVFANLVRNPFEVVKQQLMAGRAEQGLDSLRDIWRLKGLRGFYSGYKSTLARDIVFSALQLPIFEQLRARKYFSKNQTLNASASGAIAAAIAAFVSCPLDVLKTRLMTQDMAKSSTANLIARLYAEGGVKAFFTGVRFRCSIICFGGVVYFGALQQARQFLVIDE